MTSSSLQTAHLTLMEVVALLLVLAVLAVFFLPHRCPGREKARRVNCAGNLKQIGLALLMYSGDNAEQMPPGSLGDTGGYFPNTVSNWGNSFGNLASEGYISSDGKVWACPSTLTPRTSVNNSTYIYLGSGLLDDNDTATGQSIAFDASGNHPGNAWMNAVFIDGHVEGAKPDGGKVWNLN